jgi:RNA methyltransferase, TrmH family
MAGTRSNAIEPISARDNPLLKRLRRLAQEPAAYRQQGLLWLEGEHLCDAALRRGWQPQCIVLSNAGLQRQPLLAMAAQAERAISLSDALFAGLSGLPSAPLVAGLWPLPAAQPIQPRVHSLVLDRVQDPGNVGSILRSAAAFGVQQVLALEGTAALWSPKVLRAAMGAPFGLSLHEGLRLQDLQALDLPWVGADVQGAEHFGEQALPYPAALLLGHEGQGLAPELLARCQLRLRIRQPGGEESLNVAAAAAVALHEWVRGGAAAGPGQ